MYTYMLGIHICTYTHIDKCTHCCIATATCSWEWWQCMCTIFIRKVVFICLTVSVNLVYKFQGKPGTTTVKHDFNPNGLKFHRGSPWVSILSWLNLKANKDYFSYEYMYTYILRTHIGTYTHIHICTNYCIAAATCSWEWWRCVYIIWCTYSTQTCMYLQYANMYVNIHACAYTHFNICT